MAKSTAASLPHQDVFDRCWEAYPKTPNNCKQSARRAWHARMVQKVDPEVIYAGVLRYADYIRATGRWGTHYVKHAATFWGPDHHYENDYTPPAEPERPDRKLCGLLGFYATEPLL